MAQGEKAGGVFGWTLECLTMTPNKLCEVGLSVPHHYSQPQKIEKVWAKMEASLEYERDCCCLLLIQQLPLRFLARVAHPGSHC